METPLRIVFCLNSLFQKVFSSKLRSQNKFYVAKIEMDKEYALLESGDG